LALVGLVLIHANGVAYAEPGASPGIGDYTLVDERTLAVAVYDAPLSWTRVTNLVETPTDVFITIESLYWPIPLPQTAMLTSHDVPVSLSSPLGARTVRDARGVAIKSRLESADYAARNREVLARLDSKNRHA